MQPTWQMGTNEFCSNQVSKCHCYCDIEPILFNHWEKPLTLKITGRRQAQLAGGPVDCDVSQQRAHWFSCAAKEKQGEWSQVPQA